MAAELLAAEIHSFCCLDPSLQPGPGHGHAFISHLSMKEKGQVGNIIEALATAFMVNPKMMGIPDSAGDVNPYEYLEDTRKTIFLAGLARAGGTQAGNACLVDWGRGAGGVSLIVDFPRGGWG